MSTHTWSVLRDAKSRLWTRRIKMIGQRKPGRCTPCKRFILLPGRDPGTLSLSLPMCLSTGIALFLLWINALLASLPSVFMKILFCKAQGLALITDHWSSGQDLVFSPNWLDSQSLAENPSPATSQGHLRSYPPLHYEFHEFTSVSPMTLLLEWMKEWMKKLRAGVERAHTRQPARQTQSEHLV